MKLPRPSQGYQWGKCAGSQSMQDPFDETATEAAMEGTAAHWVAEQMLIPYFTEGESLKTSEIIGTLAPNGVLVTDEMFQAAKDYVSNIIKYCNTNGLIRNLQVEKTLNLDDIYPGMKGTPDCWLYDPYTMTIILWDLKFGYSLVEIFENVQFLCYIKGILDHLKIDGISDQSITIIMRVIQPRAFHKDGPIRDWVIKASDLRGYFNQITAAAHAAMDPNAKCNVGKHCHYCLAKHNCQTLQRNAQNAMDLTYDATPWELTNENLAFELTLLKRAQRLLTDRITGLEEQAINEIKGGEYLPGWKLDKTFTREKWKNDTPAEQIALMGDLMGVDIRKPLELITPTQVKKAGVDPKIVDMYSNRYPTGFKMVEDDNSDMRKAFGKSIKI